MKSVALEPALIYLRREHSNALSRMESELSQLTGIAGNIATEAERIQEILSRRFDTGDTTPLDKDVYAIFNGIKILVFTNFPHTWDNFDDLRIRASSLAEAISVLEAGRT